jgi:hypothetical protein
MTGQHRHPQNPSADEDALPHADDAVAGRRDVSSSIPVSVPNTIKTVSVATK